VLAIVVYPGLTVGPGAGHFYAEDRRRFWGGAPLRGIVLPLAVYGAAAPTISFGISNQRSSCDDGTKLGLCLIAAGLYWISVIKDLAELDDSVYDYNLRHDFAELGNQPYLELSAKELGVLLTYNF
jgi:hypothetical protein